MKFLCLGYYDEKKYDAMPKEEIAAIESKCKAHDDALHQGGHLLMVASLGPTRDSRSIRPKSGKPTFTDGPFAEAKETVGSFFIIDARNMEEAVEVAARHPAAHLGETMGWGVEVRPIDYFEET